MWFAPWKINDKVDKVGSGRAIYGYIELTYKWMSCHGHAAWTLRMPSNTYKYMIHMYTHAYIHLHMHINTYDKCLLYSYT